MRSSRDNSLHPAENGSRPPPVRALVHTQTVWRVGVKCSAMILYPEDRIPFPRLVPLGMQHVVAMFGATVLAPTLMGFNPQVALFFSGIGTLIFILITGFRVPSYLGSSFAFIGPVLAVTGGDASKSRTLSVASPAPPRYTASPRWSRFAGAPVGSTA